MIRKVFSDLPASFVVFLVALPLCMGIAIASGVPPALGLITGIVGGIVTGMLAGAPLQVSGPAAGLTVLVFQAVHEYGITALGPIVFFSGVLQILAGSARIGVWFRAVNPAVIYGMLSGIGVIIISSQIHIAFDAKPGGSVLENFMLIPPLLGKLVSSSSMLYAALVSATSLIIMFSWDKLRPDALKSLPAPLIAVSAATIFSFTFSLPIEYVSLPSSFVESLNAPQWNDWKMLLNSHVLVSAIGISVIASAETLLCASALRKMKFDAEVKYNKELFAQGVGNAICGLLGALPMTGVIVRSTANISANAKTRWSAVFHGIWLLLFILAFPNILQSIPMASLAAILVYTGLKLVNPEVVKSLSRYGRPAVVIYFATVLSIVFTDLLTGVLIGIGISFIRLLTVFSSIKIRVHKKEDQVYHVALKGAATFLTLPKIASTLEAIPVDQHVQLEFDQVFYIDHACMDLLESQKSLREKIGGSLLFDSSKLNFAWKKSERGTITHPTFNHSQKGQLA